MTRTSLLVVMLFFGISAFAQFSFNLGATSDFVWRGVTQTEEDPALQGGVDYAHASGFYAGAWASNVSFDGDSDVEVDFYLGTVIPLPSNLKLDLGYVRYEYFDLDGIDEAYLGLSYNNLQIKYCRGFEVKSDYLETSLEVPLANEFELGFHVGYFDDGSDYLNWKASISRPWKGFEFELAFTDTDLQTDNADARLALTVIKRW
ncbi:MAG: hypothetical protein CR997_07280 [Acidobacteria bacterium]|nr:MAG: hypothetical protein CR997_07280 [Acidobacteriota bacterium]